jgi:hypothetical protein
MKTKQWVLLAIWFVCYEVCLQFFRFKFGLFEISAVFMIIGIPLMLFFGRPNKPNSD